MTRDVILIPGLATKTRGCFAANCLSVHRRQLDSSQKFHCQNLIGHTSTVIVAEFSEGGTLLLASGGYDKIARLWPISSGAEGELNSAIAPFEMETRQESAIYCLAISSDKNRLISGEKNGKVFINDVAT